MATEKSPFKVKQTVKYVRGSVKASPYNVPGETLEEVHDIIKKNGPVVRGKRFAAATDCIPAGIQPKYETHVEEQDGEFLAYARFDKTTIKFRFLVHQPKAGSVRLKDKDELATWKAFHQEVLAHEKDHIEDFEKEIALIVDEVSAYFGMAKHKDRKKAEKKAKLDLQSKFKEDFTESKLKARLDKRADDFDAVTGHGPTLEFTTHVH